MVLPRPQVILIDYLGTITVPVLEAARSAVEGLGLSPADASQAFSSLRGYWDADDSVMHQAERGEVSTEVFVDWMESNLAGSSQLFSPEPPSILRAPERPEMRRLLEELAAEDEFVMLATNNLAHFQDYLAASYLDTGLVNAVINSAMVGSRKPENDFWQLCVDTAEVDHDEIVLLDDSTANITAAREFGFQTIEVGEDAGAAIDQLRARMRT